MNLDPTLTLDGVFTFLSILVAACLGVASLRQAQKQSRRQHTIDVMLARFSGGDMANKLQFIRTWELGGKDPPDGKELIYEVNEVLNLYEFISAAARRGALDPALICDVRGGAMLKTQKFFKEYIKERREADENHRLWEHFDWFVKHEVLARR